MYVCDLIGALRCDLPNCYVLLQYVMSHPYIALLFIHNKHLPRQTRYLSGDIVDSRQVFIHEVCVCVMHACHG